MNLRLATCADILPIASLHVASWQTTYRGMLSDRFLDEEAMENRRAQWKKRLEEPAVNQFVLVVDEGEDLVGFVCAYGREEKRWGTMLDNLHVHPHRKGQGIGGRLISAVAAWCTAQYPGEGLFLWALEQNHSARNFYERLGGVTADRLDWNAPDGSIVGEVRYVWADPSLLIR